MRTLKLGVCFLDEEDNIITKRVIDAQWEVNIEQDLRDNFNVCMEDEIATILTENLKLQLQPDIVKEMLNEVREKEKE